MGLFKNIAKNKKKLRVSVAAKKLKKVFKKKANQDVVMDEEQIAQVAGTMEIDEPNKSVPKKVPIVREGKIKRTQLPLVPPSHVKKGSEKTNKKADNKGGVLFQRPLTKKKARKLLRDQAREERNREREESKMQQ